MRRRAQPDQKQPMLFDNASKPSWPVIHPEALLQSTSDEHQGGPLNAIEAGRVTSRQSIAFAGHIYISGLTHCRTCALPPDDPLVPGNGFRMTIYKGTPYDRFVGKCGKCGVAVVGEDPRRKDWHKEPR